MLTILTANVLLINYTAVYIIHHKTQPTTLIRVTLLKCDLKL